MPVLMSGFLSYIYIVKLDPCYVRWTISVMYLCLVDPFRAKFPSIAFLSRPDIFRFRVSFITSMTFCHISQRIFDGSC